MERTPVPPVFQVYRLNICEAIDNDHAHCPGIGVLTVGKIKLGRVACNCECHKVPREGEN